jgi:hypothetical protein
MKGLATVERKHTASYLFSFFPPFRFSLRYPFTFNYLRVGPAYLI